MQDMVRTLRIHSRQRVAQWLILQPTVAKKVLWVIHRRVLPSILSHLADIYLPRNGVSDRISKLWNSRRDSFPIFRRIKSPENNFSTSWHSQRKRNLRTLLIKRSRRVLITPKNTWSLVISTTATMTVWCKRSLVNIHHLEGSWLGSCHRGRISLFKMRTMRKTRRCFKMRTTKPTKWSRRWCRLETTSTPKNLSSFSLK